MLMTKFLHLIAFYSQKTFWNPDKSTTSFSLRGKHVLHLLVASEFLPACSLDSTFLSFAALGLGNSTNFLTMVIAYTTVFPNKVWS